MLEHCFREMIVPCDWTIVVWCGGSQCSGDCYIILCAGCVVCILYLQHSDPDEEKIMDLETLENKIM